MKQNPGLLPPPKKSDLQDWQEDKEDNDLVWKASRMLDQLERFEEVKVDHHSERSTGGGGGSTGGNNVFGEIQPVPWLDTLAKEFCHNTLKEAVKKAGVRIEGYRTCLSMVMLISWLSPHPHHSPTHQPHAIIANIATRRLWRD